MKRETYNTDGGVSPTILAGYYKFGTATLIGGVWDDWYGSD